MASNPPRARAVPEVMTPQGPYATQGMISPANSFVNADGTLTGVSFRFLWGLFQAIQQLQQEVTTLQQTRSNP